MLYPKIMSPFYRHTEGPNKGKLIIGEWVNIEFQALATASWWWTEKIDGTNVRIHWDGHRPAYHGRTDRAQIPGKLFEYLNREVTEEILEQVFGSKEVWLFGEGYGAGIQSGGIYSQDQEFALFDVYIDGYWLLPDSIRGIAQSLGLKSAEGQGWGTVDQAISRVVNQEYINPLCSPDRVEGLVGVPMGGLLDRHGGRIQMKVKRKDFSVEATD